MQGAVGPVGPQGPKGDSSGSDPSESTAEFCEVYSKTNQTLAASPGLNLAGGVVLLENLVVTTSNIDTTQASITGVITIKKAGWYDVASGMTGALNPISTPLPVWTLSLFKNGVIVDGSTFANMTISPEQKSNEITADVFIYFDAGDELLLANTSTAAVSLNAPSLGTNAQTNSAYLKIRLLRYGAK